MPLQPGQDAAHRRGRFREGWDIAEALWAGTVQRARVLPPELLHERVDGEWSFIETLRHLLFATDIWVRRAIEELTEECLASSTEPVEGPGYPAAEAYPVEGCLSTVLGEEWQHRIYAERDLDVLEARARS